MMDALVAEGRLQWLLDQVAEESRPCRFCGATLYFVRLRAHPSVRMPLTAEAVNHFQDCPHFQKAKTKPGGEQQSLLDVAPTPL